MDDNDNPYEILGVSPNASSDEVKRAYRKAALQHHPDRQTTEAAKQAAHIKFAQISNAYEILSDDTQRRQYDYQQGGLGGMDFTSPGFAAGMGGVGGLHDFMHSSFHQSHPFHDPFAVFEQVFREEFGGGGSGGGPTGDSGFFPRGFGMMPGMMGGFDDPFFSGSGGLGRQPSRGGGGDPFQGMLSSMMRPPPNMGGGAGHPQQQSQVVYSSSTTSGFGGPGSQSVSTSTTTRIVNGKQETVTERVVRHPDGRVERSVQSSHGDTTTATTGGAIENGSNQTATGGTIENGSNHKEEKPKHERRGLLSWVSNHGKNKKNNDHDDQEDSKPSHKHKRNNFLDDDDKEDSKPSHKRKHPPSHHGNDD